MILNTRIQLKTLNGTLIVGEDNAPITIGMIIANALLAQTKGSTPLSGEEHIKRYELARKVFQEVEVELKAEQVVLIKKCVSDTYTTLYAGQILEVLDSL
jgi:bifunctional DNase/RNase